MKLKGLLATLRKGRLDKRMLGTKGYIYKNQRTAPPPSQKVGVIDPHPVSSSEVLIFLYLAPGWIFSHTVLVSERKKKTEALVISHNLVIVNLKNPAQLGYFKSGLARIEACWLISVALLERLNTQYSYCVL